jgi:hypothetical protein
MSLYKNTTKIIVTTPLLSTGAGPEGGVVKIPVIFVNINNRDHGILSTPPLLPAPVDKIGVVKKRCLKLCGFQDFVCFAEAKSKIRVAK